MKKLLLLLCLLVIGLKAFSQKEKLKVDITRQIAKGVALTSKHKCNFDTVKIVLHVTSTKSNINDTEVFSSDEGYKRQYVEFFKDANNKHLKQLQSSLLKLLKGYYPKVKSVSLMIYAFNTPGYDDCDVTVSTKDLQNIIRKSYPESSQSSLSLLPIITTIGPSVIE